MTLLSKCAEFTAKFEGCRLESYYDSVGVLTIGYGTIHGVEPHMRITESQALDWLSRDLETSYKSVLRLIKPPLNQNQYIALIDFVYNVGSGSLQRSSLRMKLNRGDMSIEKELLKWNKGGGKVLRGLTMRRQEEAKLWGKQ